ncbi:MAG: aspartate kinase [Bacteroidetes bacterium]|nr:aspartate kinase [Bacteroidota bacterium]
MKVFKFGGASVKDATSVKNVANVLSLFKDEELVIVVSAMGKTTNALEQVVNAYFHKDDKLGEYIEEVKNYHLEIIEGLGFKKDHRVYEELSNMLVEIDWILEEEPARGYAFAYDQIVSQGELISTKIVSAYLNENKFGNEWLDIRDCLITDDTYREGKVNWDLTEKLVMMKIPALLKKEKLVITQGFIGATPENFTTTLGREGSDYTAAILSYCLAAEEMIVWKDVPGVLSADPKYYEDAVKLQEISYLDAIELTYYGATVIHPKTIKPLENKNIPLRVCSFISPKEKGTSIWHHHETKPLVPSFIFKTNQILISISAKDFSFIAEDCLSRIFGVFAKHKVKINLMQNSAVSFSACVDNDTFKIPGLISELHLDFKVLYNEGLKLITVRHYYPSTIEMLIKDKTILLEQRSRHTAQIVLKEE